MPQLRRNKVPVKYYEKEEGEITPSESEDDDYIPDEDNNLDGDNNSNEDDNNSDDDDNNSDDDDTKGAVSNKCSMCISVGISMLVGVMAGCFYMMPVETQRYILNAQGIEMW